MTNYLVENLFGIDGLNIAWYGVIIGLGVLAGIILASYRAKKKGIRTDFLYDYLLIAIPLSILGARLYYVVFQWDYYREHPGEIFAIWHGGLAIYGGVLCAILIAILFCRKKKLSFSLFADVCIPGLLLGQAIGRWGNFANQEAFGNLVTDPALQFFPYAVYIERLNEWHQATFFYECAWNLILLVILLTLSRRPKPNGWMLSGYLIGYGIGRFWIEGLRADSLYLLPNLRISQVVSIVLVMVGLSMMIYFWHNKTKHNGLDGRNEQRKVQR